MLQYLTKHLLLNPLALSGDGQFLASWLLFCTFFSYCHRQNNSLQHMALRQSSLDITLCKVQKDLLPYKSSQLHEIGCHTHLSAIPKERDREEKKLSKKLFDCCCTISNSNFAKHIHMHIIFRQQFIMQNTHIQTICESNLQCKKHTDSLYLKERTCKCKKTCTYCWEAAFDWFWKICCENWFSLILSPG